MCDVCPFGVDGDCPIHYPPATNMESPSGKCPREHNLLSTSQMLACPAPHPELLYLQTKYDHRLPLLLKRKAIPERMRFLKPQLHSVNSTQLAGLYHTAASAT